MSDKKQNELKSRKTNNLRLILFYTYFIKFFRISLIVLFIPFFLSFVFLDLWLDTPSIEDNINSNENNGSIIIDKNTNQIIASYPGQSKYESISIYKMPENLIKAVLSLEDKNFFDNPAGIPWSSLIKVNVDCLAGASDQCRGGSGIVQQLVKNTKGDDSRSINRKVTELFLSLKLSQNVSKQTLLEAYLNNVYYGQNSYGVETASKKYFGHSVASIDETGKYLISDTKACFLASLLQSPDTYSQALFVINNPDTRFADRINFCQKNIDSTSLSYFETTGNLQKYSENVQTEELFSEIKLRLSGKSQTTKQTIKTPSQIIATKADQLILTDYSVSVLRSNNWIFYIDYDKNQPINDELKLQISKQESQKCTQNNCQESQSSNTLITNFRLLSWSKLFKYSGWFLISMAIVFVILTILNKLYLSIAPKSWLLNTRPKLIQKSLIEIRNLLIFMRRLVFGKR
jgi:membrane peptidoglycan carboxypeptidase